MSRRLTLRSDRSVAAYVFAGYALVAFLYLGLAPLIETGSQYVGHAYDPQIFIWSFAWWPHAILNGENPFLTRAVWSPIGVNLAWATTVPGLALLFWPLTELAGPIVSYDVAAVLMPALAASTAFLLCRYLTRSLWPSLVGGYLFGFSSYLLGQAGGGGHLQLSSVFLVPLVALAVLRFLDGELGGRGLALRVGPFVALQALFSTEVAFTVSLALAVGWLLGFALAPGSRPRLVSLLRPLAGAFCVAAILISPLLYFLLTGFQSAAFNSQNGFVADLANFVVPTRITAIGGSWLSSISGRFPGNQGEQDAYLGLPTLLIVGAYARERLRSSSGRFLLAALVLAVVASLGGQVTVAGHALVTGPWALVDQLPLFDNVLATRLPLYVSLVAAVVVACWTASRRAGVARRLVPLLAALAIVPDPSAGGFATTYYLPAFFTSSTYRNCLDPAETVLPLPLRGGWSLLWQVESGFRFDLAGGDIGPDIPNSFFEPASVVPITGGLSLGPGQTGGVSTYVADNHVSSIVVDGSLAANFVGAIDPLATPHRLGGVVLYQTAPYPPSCPGA